MPIFISRDIVLGEPAVVHRTGFQAVGSGSFQAFTVPPYSLFLLKPVAKRIYTIEMTYEILRSS